MLGPLDNSTGADAPALVENSKRKQRLGEYTDVSTTVAMHGCSSDQHRTNCIILDTHAPACALLGKAVAVPSCNDLTMMCLENLVWVAPSISTKVAVSTTDPCSCTQNRSNML